MAQPHPQILDFGNLDCQDEGARLTLRRVQASWSAGEREIDVVAMRPDGGEASFLIGREPRRRFISQRRGQRVRIGSVAKRFSKLL